MASQRPWFRMNTMRPPAPAATPAPPPARPPPVVRPAIPIRPPPPPPAQPQAPPAASQPPTAPPSPPAPTTAAAPPVKAPTPPRTPVAPPAPRPSPRRTATAATPPPPSSPAAKAAVATSTSIQPPSPPRPATAAAPPPPPSPVEKTPVATRTNTLPPSLPKPAAAATPPPPSSPIAKPNSVNTQPPSPPKPAAAATSPPPASLVTKSAVATPPNINQPPSPQIKKQSPSPSPSPSPSSLPKSTNLRSATPILSPKTLNAAQIKPSSQSPHPLSPLQLPPPQINPSEEPKIEQKSVLIHESTTNPTKPNTPHKYGAASKDKREKPNPKNTITKLSDSDESGMRIITIAGDNRGALMEINSSHKKSHPYTLANAKTPKSAEEGKSDKNPAMQSQPTATFLNSNVQGINNSIVYNSNYNHNDPGIHLSLVRRVYGNGGRGNNGQNHHG